MCVYMYANSKFPYGTGRIAVLHLLPTRGESACPHVIAWYAPPCSTYHTYRVPPGNRTPNARKQRRGMLILLGETDTVVPVGCIPPGRARLAMRPSNGGKARAPTPQG